MSGIDNNCCKIIIPLNKKRSEENININNQPRKQMERNCGLLCQHCIHAYILMCMYDMLIYFFVISLSFMLWLRGSSTVLKGSCLSSLDVYKETNYIKKQILIEMSPLAHLWTGFCISETRELTYQTPLTWNWIYPPMMFSKNQYVEAIPSYLVLTSILSSVP